MPDKIFGYDWDDIQRAQSGGRLHKAIDVHADQHADIAKHADADAVLLAQYGADGLRAAGFWGVVDRLTRAGIIK